MSADIVKYIKDIYPRVIFNKIDLSNVTGNKKALGFIITDNKLIMGYISRNGNLCKLIEPIDLNNISNDNFISLIRRIPIVDGFDKNDKNKIIELLDKSKDIISRDEINNELNDSLRDQKSELEASYKVMVDGNNISIKNLENQILLIKSDKTEEIKRIKYEYEDRIIKIKESGNVCKDKLLYEKDIIIEAIKDYKVKMSEYILKEVNKTKDAESIIEKLLKEKEGIEKTLKEMTERELVRLNEIKSKEEDVTDFSYQINTKQDENNRLNETITLIKSELEDIREKFSKSEIEKSILDRFKNECITKILKEKELIIIKIKEYNESWLMWSKGTDFNIKEYKNKLNNDIILVTENLKGILKFKDEYINKLDISDKSKNVIIRELENNVMEIKNVLNKSMTEQLTAMSIKNEEARILDESIINEKNLEIIELQRQLEDVRKLIVQNNNNIVPKNVDYENCYDIFYQFIQINNMFSRKKKIINILDNIIFNNVSMSVFSNLSDNIKNSIKVKYEIIRDNINKHIDFLNLQKYLNDPNAEYFKSKNTVKKVTPKYCQELFNIGDYWQDNIIEYREQDRLLTNIYEDLSGSVRVYVKIKPLIGVVQKDNTVFIETIQNKKQKRISIDCTNAVGLSRNIKKETYGNFYGVFDETFSNLDVYTGVENSITKNGSKYNVDLDDIIENTDSVSPGLYNTFKQVEDGYSIVLFGYGGSGSGKTFTILGQEGKPGLIHYGLANLTNVQNIKIKNIFEQYINKFTPTLNNISGKIHNLVREVPQMKNFSINENVEFGNSIPSLLNLDNLSIDDLNTLTFELEKYRIEKGRVKKTPNNTVSSRSHLYIIFEIKFNTGKIGYITIVDTAGRESPIDIYNVFIDNTKKYKPTLTTLLGPTGGPDIISRSIKKEYLDEYNPIDVFNILKEGVYINESINHLIYFFNEKNYKKTKIQFQKSLDNYTTEKYYVDPNKEINKIDTFNNVLTIPIMKFLDSISSKGDDFTPTKFITLVLVRKDEIYCNQIFNTLKFASDIAST